MSAKAWLPIIAILLGLLGTRLAWAADTATLDTPPSVPAGARFLVKWAGPGRGWDRIAIVLAGAPDNASPDSPWSKYAQGTEVWLLAWETPGEYEVRYLGRDPKALLARHAITITAARVKSAATGSASRPRAVRHANSVKSVTTGSAWLLRCNLNQLDPTELD